MRSVIIGTGSYIPSIVKTNKDFANHNFYAEDNTRIETDPHEVVEKFRMITGIEERRYTSANIQSSDMAAMAAKEALADAKSDGEDIDQIILAHNFGNVLKHTIQTDAMPALASRVKNKLGIKNPNCICYDILFGCPGWIQGMIQADAFFKAGLAKKCLVIGTEALSRVIDVYDRDSMIFSDGAGATVIAAQEGSDSQSGILASVAQSHCGEELDYLYMGKSFFPESDARIRYIKMKGRKVYEYAMKYVPQAMKACLDNAGVEIGQLKKVFLHQANEKMDEGIIKAMYKLYGATSVPDNIMPLWVSLLPGLLVGTWCLNMQ